MNQHTRYVGFDGQQVVVHSEAPEILAGLEQNFGCMLQEAAPHPVARLEAGLANGLYYLRENEQYWKNESLEDILFYLNTEVVLRLVRARPDLVWLHAGAAANQGRAVLVSGKSGRGKSTIIATLCALGWHFLSDDVTPLNPETGRVLAFPQTPMFRRDPGHDIPADRLHELPKVVANIGPAGVCREAVPVSVVVFPQYNSIRRTALTPCPPAAAALELLQNCLNFCVRPEKTFHYLCKLVESLSSFHLYFNSVESAAQLLAEAQANAFQRFNDI